MMAAERFAPTLLDRLPKTRGAVSLDAPLSDLTWFGVGGAADALFRPADEEDLAAFLKGCPRDIPVTVLGVGSNLLVRDGGVAGVVIRLGRGFARVRVEGDEIRAGAGASDVAVSLAAKDAGLAGLEFLRGVPGSVGGAIRMNAGAYGGEIKDVLVRASALDRQGRRHDVAAVDLGFAYRHSSAPVDWIFTSAAFKGRKDSVDAIAARMTQIANERGSSQPVKTRTGGSTFKNPTDAEGRKAWQLIDAAGCRGMRRGGAQVSPLHCNFLINTGDATAEDLESLGEEVRRRVLASSGVQLEWEIRVIGRAKKGGSA